MKPTRAEDWDRPRNVRRKFGPVPPSFAEHVHDGGFFNTSPVPVFVKTGPALFRRGVRDPRRVIVRAQFQVIHLIVYPVFENIPGMDAKGKKRRIRTAVVPRDSGRFSGPGNLEEIPSDPPRFPFIWKGTIMNVTVRDIAAFMDAWAPRTLAYDWDKVGLHTGRPDSAVTGVLACLTITPDAFRAANRAGANMIVAHHPLIWSPLKQLRSDDPQSRLCVEIAASGVACFVAHTNLDLAPGGVNDVLAERLDLQESGPLFPAEHVKQVKLVTFVPAGHVDVLRNALARVGAGVIGKYTHCSFQVEGTGSFRPGCDANPFCGSKGVLSHETELRFEMLLDSGAVEQAVSVLRAVHPYEEPAFDLVPLLNQVSGPGLGRRGLLKKPVGLPEFAALTRKALGLHHVLCYRASKGRVRRVAVLGGSGGGSVADLPDDVDVFVSGDIGYHDVQTAVLRGISCLDAGHAGTELPIVDVIRQRLQREFKGLPVAAYRERPLGTVAC